MSSLNIKILKSASFAPDCRTILKLKEGEEKQVAEVVGRRLCELGIAKEISAAEKKKVISNSPQNKAIAFSSETKNKTNKKIKEQKNV